MFILENVRLALAAIKANKMRSLLTMLGIIIGICSVITITSIGNSLKDTLQSALNMLGGRVLYINYERADENYRDNYTNISREDYVTDAMLDEIEKRFNGRYLAVRNHSVGKSTLTDGVSKDDLILNVSGASEGFIKENSNFYKLVKGRYPSSEDNKKKKHTVIVSDYFAEKYFGKGKNVLGEDLHLSIENVGKAEFTIVGIYELSPYYRRRMNETGKTMATPAFIPYNTATSLKSKKGDTDASEIYINDKHVDSAKAVEELGEYFDEKYKNNKHWKAYVFSMTDDIDYSVKLMNVLTIVLGVIAAVSLLVGGIGVMNIMMVSITERTREIGVRKALGAKNSAIRLQFLVESAILCLVGGVIGILIGIFNGFLVEAVGGFLLKQYPEYSELVELNIRVSPGAILIALIFSTIVGLFFGSYPASKAAKLDPIDALRYE